MPHPPPSIASACRSNRGGSGRPVPTGSACPCKGRIAADEQSDEGRALARLTDLGWGGTLREMFAAGAADAPVPPKVLAACVRVLADWGWAERPVAVVAMPSRSQPQLVGSLARGIADVGRMPLLGALDLVDGGPTGRARRQQRVPARRGLGAVQRRRSRRAGGPVLLVDDLVDSRWTITVAARELRGAGATEVLPFALALRG